MIYGECWGRKDERRTVKERAERNNDRKENREDNRKKESGSQKK